jgi:hypothetical protein
MRADFLLASSGVGRDSRWDGAGKSSAAGRLGADPHELDIRIPLMQAGGALWGRTITPVKG